MQFFFKTESSYYYPLSRATLSLRPALRRSGCATLPIGGRLSFANFFLTHLVLFARKGWIPRPLGRNKGIQPWLQYLLRTTHTSLVRVRMFWYRGIRFMRNSYPVACCGVRWFLDFASQAEALDSKSNFLQKYCDESILQYECICFCRKLCHRC